MPCLCESIENADTSHLVAGNSRWYLQDFQSNRLAELLSYDYKIREEVSFFNNRQDDGNGCRRGSMQEEMMKLLTEDQWK